MKPFDPRVLRLVPRARGPLVALAALGTLSGLAAIAQAFAVAAVVVALVGVADGGGAGGGNAGDLATLWRAVGVAALVFAVRGVLAGAGEVVAARTGAIVSGALRGRYVAALAAARVDARPDAAAATTLATQGASSIEPYVARYLPTLVAAAVLPPAAVVAMACLDLPTAVIPLLTLPLLPLFAALIGSATADATARRWRTLARLSGHFLDVMRGLPTLVTYGRARRQVETIARVSDDHRRATVATLRIAFLSSGALELLATLSVAIVAVWTGIHLAAGSMRLDVALPLILLAPEAYWPIRRVGAEFHAAADGAAALDDLAHGIETLEAAPVHPTGAGVGAAGVGSIGVGSADGAGGGSVVVDRVGGVRAADGVVGTGGGGGTGVGGGGGTGGGAEVIGGGDGAQVVGGGRGATAVGRGESPEAVGRGEGCPKAVGAASPEVVVRGLAHRYDDALPFVLRGVDARLGVGLTAVTGPSGVGKTTFLELLAGLRAPTEGEVRAPAAHLLTQRPFVAPASLADNLRLGARPGTTDADLLDALDRVGLGGLVGRGGAGAGPVLPRGLGSELGDDGFGLSAGQRARVALARALLSGAPLLLVDEPTAHLDADAQDVVHGVLRELARTRVVVAVTHRDELVALADDVLVLAPATAEAAR